MRFSTFVFRNISRRPLRALLTVVAIAIAIGAVEAFVGIATGFRGSFMALYSQADVDITVVRAGIKERGRHVLPESLGIEIGKVEGVKEVILGVMDFIALTEFGLDNVLMQGLEPETIVFKHMEIRAGEPLKKTHKRSIIIGTKLARNLGKTVGDEVELLEKERFKIVGIYETNNVFENGALVMPLREMQKLVGKVQQVTGFSLILTRPRDEALIAKVRPEIEKVCRDKGTNVAAMPTQDHVKSISEINQAEAMAWLTSAIALLIGFFGMMNTMIMSVAERTREIGILRALGWRVRRVIRMVLLESVFLSIVGAALGTIGAIVLVRILTRVPMVSGLIEGKIDPFWIMVGFLIAIGVGLVGGLFPAFRAARMLPTEALRHE